MLHRTMVTGGKDDANQEAAGGEGCSGSLLSCLQEPELRETMGRPRQEGEFALKHEAWLSSVSHAVSCQSTDFFEWVCSVRKMF